MEEQEVMKYESGIYGKAEVRFGGKIALHVVSYENTPTHGIALAEFYDAGTPGNPPPTQEHHKPQVFLVFDNIKSVEMLEEALMTVRELLKRDAEKARHRQPDNPLLQTPLTSCNLSVRTLSICKSADINTLGDLTRLRKTDLLNFRNFGKKSLTELDELLTDNGLTWASV